MAFPMKFQSIILDFAFHLSAMLKIILNLKFGEMNKFQCNLKHLYPMLAPPNELKKSY